MADDEIAEAQPGEVAFELSWRADANGRLAGHLDAQNVCGHPVLLSGKPGLRPLGLDGEPLGADCVVSLEMRMPGHVELAPGERARAAARWAGWDGPEATGRVIVSWPGGAETVLADGPRQPTSRGPATNLSTSWFEREE